MTDTPYHDLAARIEAADGPDRGLDAEIELATGNWGLHQYDAWHRYREYGPDDLVPMCQPVEPGWFTSSIDAAMTSAEAGSDPLDLLEQALASARDARDGIHFLPMHVCVACLRARSA